MGSDLQPGRKALAQAVSKASRLSNNAMLLEPRIMFDAAAVATGMEALDHTVEPQIVPTNSAAEIADLTQALSTHTLPDIQALGGEAAGSIAPESFSQDSFSQDSFSQESAAPASTAIIFVDTRVQDYTRLLHNIDDQAEVVLISNDQDGLQVIADTLKGRVGVDAIHLLSHGENGRIQLGNDWFDSTDIADRNALLGDIGKSLSVTGDVLVYGCRVAEGESGIAFINQLAATLQADVAASTDATGVSGDWELEYVSGDIDTDVNTQVLESSGYSHDLALGYTTQSSLTERGAVGTLQQNASADDANLQLTPGSGFSFSFMGTTYSSFYVSSNSYITFGGGSSEYSGLDGDTPARPGIHIGGADNSYQRIYSGFTDANNNVYWVRYEGTAATSGTVGSPNIVWEAWFYKDSDRVDLFVISNARTSGTAGVSDGSGAAFDLAIPITAGTKISITTSTNTAPTLSAVTGPTYTDTNSSDTFSNHTGTLSGSDADGNTLTYGITGGTVSSGVSTLTGTYGTLSVNTTTGAYTFTPNANAINALSSNTTESFTVSVNDGTTSATQTYTVTLNGTNDTPVLSAITGTTYTDTSATDTFSTASGTLAGSDADTGATLTYGVTGGTDNGTTVSLVGTYGTLSVTKATGAYTYTPDASAINALSAGTTESFTLTASDGALSTSRTYTITLSGTNDTPVLAAVTGASYTDTSATDTFSNSTGTLSGSDSDTSATLSYGITGGTDNGTTVSLTGSYGTLTVNKTSGAFTYVPNASSINALSSAVTDSFTVTVSDGTLSATRTYSVSIAGSNDAPLFALNTASASYTENASATLLATGATLSDAENNWNGATLVASISANAESADRLGISASGSVSVSGTSVLYNSVAIGSVNISGGETTANNTLTITFNSSADATAIQAVVRALSYRSVSETPSTTARTISINLTDAASASAGAQTLSLSVTTANDTPTISATTPQSVTEDVATALSGITLADVDAGASAVVATFSVGSGSLSGTTGISGVSVGGSASSLTLTGSVSDINSYIAAGYLQFTTAAHSTTNVTLSVSVNDQGNTGGSAQTSTTATVTLAVSAVNDAPTSANGTVSLNEDSTRAFSSSDFTFTDVDGDSLHSIRIVTLPTAGTLTLNGNAVTTLQLIPAASLGQLVYTPGSNANGNNYGDFTFRVYDGVTDSSSTYSMAVNVVPTNDAPTLGTIGVLTGASEDTAFSISYATLAAAANEVDIDGDTLSFRVESITTGTLTKNGSAITAGITTLASGETLVWTPAANANGILNAFTVRAGDGTTTSTNAIQVQVNVAGVNDAPSLSGNLLLPSINEDVSNPSGASFNDLLTTNNQTLIDADSGASLSGFVVVANNANAASEGAWQYSTDNGANWHAIGSVGDNANALVLTPTTQLRFVPVAQFNGNPGGLSIRALDNTYAGSFTSGNTRVTTDASAHGGSTAIAGTSNTIGTTIVAVNDAPTVTVPTTISVTEDIATSITGITLADSDAGSSNLVLTLNAASGALNAASGNGVSVGGSASALTLTGNATSLNAFIAAGNVQFTTANNATDNITLSLQVNDQGNTGGSALTSSTESILIRVTAVNDTPGVTAVSSLTVAGTGTTGVTGIQFTDVDAGSATLVASFSVNAGALTASNSAGVTVGGGDTLLTLSGTLADINAFLAAGKLGYTAGNANSAILRAEISDQGATGQGGPLSSTTAQITLVKASVNVNNHAPAMGATSTELTQLNGTTLGTMSGNSLYYGGNSLQDRTADLNGDGWLDMVNSTYQYISGTSRYSLEILISDGQGNYTSQTINQSNTSNYGGQQIKLADVDNDGDVDMVVVARNDTTSTLTLYRNNGEGVLTAATAIKLSSNSYYNYDSLQLADVNGDGTLDYLSTTYNYQNSANTSTLQLFTYSSSSNNFSSTGTTLGTFNGSVSSPVFKDINGDGDIDILAYANNYSTNSYNSSLRIYDNNGSGTFTERTIASVNGYLSTFSNTLGYMSGSTTTQNSLVDINNDGRLDIIFYSYDYNGSNYKVEAFTQGSNGTFTRTTTNLSSNELYNTRLADITGDGVLDLVCWKNNYSNSVYTFTATAFTGNGSGGFATTATTLTTITAPSTNTYYNLAAVHDLNADGKADLLYYSYSYNYANGQNTSSYSVHLLASNNSGFSTQALTSGTGNVRELQLGDLDGNDDIDIVFTTYQYGSNQTSNSLNVLVNTGEGSFNAVTATPGLSGNGYYGGGIQIADFNNDGGQDVLIRSEQYADSTSTTTFTLYKGTAATGNTDIDLGTTTEDTSKTLTVSEFLIASDADSDSVGIAITSVSGNGIWAYSTDNGSTWNTIGSASEDNALLLSATDLIRYTPDGNNGETASFSYRAWDGSNGLGHGQRADIATTGGTAAFSAASANASLEITDVNDAPIITAPATLDVGPAATETDLTGIVIRDVDAGNSPILVTLTVNNGALLAVSGSSVTVGGTSSALTLKGSIADINAFIAAGKLSFVPSANGNVTLSVSANDQASSSPQQATATLTLVVEPGPNHAPELTSAPNTLTQLEGTTLGTMSGNSLYYGGNSLQDRTADLNGDGWLDMVNSTYQYISGTSRYSLEILISDGQGNYTSQTINQSNTSNYGGQQIKLADVDNDGDVDMVVVARNDTNSTLTLYRNNGEGVLTAATAIKLSSNSYYNYDSLQLADVNGDGTLDYLSTTYNYQNSANTSTLQLFTYSSSSNNFSSTGTTLGTFNGSVSSPVFKDINGDGDIDILAYANNYSTNSYNSSLRIYDNNGSGTFTERTIASVNGYLSTFSNTLGYMSGSTTTQNSLVDINNDGRLDIIFYSYDYNGSNYKVEAFTQGSNGTFTRTTTNLSSNELYNTRLADITGDGVLDLVCWKNNYSNSVYTFTATAFTGNGSGGFATTATTLTTITAPSTNTYYNLAAVHDLNADGKADLLYYSYSHNYANGQNTSSYSVHLLASNNSGFSTQALTTGTGNVRELQLGDLDGNDDLDIVFTTYQYGSNQTSNSLNVLVNTGEGSFNAVTATPGLSGNGYYGGGIQIADFNNDGGQDVLIRSEQYADSTSTTTFTLYKGTAATGNTDIDLGTTTEDTSKTLTVSEFLIASDADSDSVGIAITSVSGNGIWAYSTDNGNTWNSIGSASEDNALLLSATDLIRYTPDGNNGETASFSYRAWDGSNGLGHGERADIATTGGTAAFSLASAIANLAVTAVNDAPAINGVQQGLAMQDTATSAPFSQITLTDPDQPADLITVEINILDNNGKPSTQFGSFTAASLQLAGFVASSNRPGIFSGSFTSAAAAQAALRQLSFDATENKVGAGQSSTLTFQLKLSDGTASTSNSQTTLVISGVNDAPTGSSISSQSMRGEGILSLPIAANLFADIDADTLSYTATLQNGDALPAWLSYDSSTHSLRGNVPGNLAGQSMVVRIIANDGNGGTAYSDITITFTGVNDRPATVGIADQIASSGSWTFTVPGNTFSDPEGGSLTYSATQIDGSPLPAWLGFDPNTRTFSGNVPNISALGIKVTATETDGKSTSTTFLLKIPDGNGANDAPTVFRPIVDTTWTGAGDQQFELPADTFIDSDADTLALTVQRVNAQGQLIGNGSLPDWLSFNATQRLFSGNPPPSFDGSAIYLRVSASDGFGGQTSDNFALTIAEANDTPEVNIATGSTVFNQSGTWTYTVPANTFADADNEALTLTATLSDNAALPDWLSFDSATRTFSGNPPENANLKTLSLQITATDAEGSSASTVLVLKLGAVNDAVTLANAIADQDFATRGTWSFTLPANTFSDLDGDTLTFSAGVAADNIELTESQSDANARIYIKTQTGLTIGLDVDSSDSLEAVEAKIQNKTGLSPDDFRLVFAGKNLDITRTLSDYNIQRGATLHLIADGVASLPDWLSFDAETRTFSGNPPPEYNGRTLTVTVVASDGKGGEISETFELVLGDVNDGPSVATPLSTQTFSGEGSWSYDVPASTFSHGDGSPLTLSANVSGGAALPDWLSFDASTGRFSGNPPAGQADLAIVVTATDSVGVTASSAFVLNLDQSVGTNDTPTASAIEPITLTGSGTLTTTLPLASIFSDADGETLSYTLTMADGSALPSWLSFNAETGEISGNAPESVNELGLLLRAQDASGSETGTHVVLRFESTNDTPSTTLSLSGITFAESGEWRYQVPSTVFEDLDGDSLSFTATLGDGSALPAWLSFNAAKGIFSGNPPGALSNQTLTLSVIASDPYGAETTLTFDVEFGDVNDTPTAIAIPDQRFESAGDWTYTVPEDTFNDPENGTLIYSATQSDGSALPAWLNFNAATRTFSGNPPNGVVNVFLTVTATNAGEASVSSDFKLSIPDGSANDAPETIASYSDIHWEGAGLQQTVVSGKVFADPDGDLLTLAVTQADGSNLPSWLQYNATTRVLSGNPPPSLNGETLVLRVTATDTLGASTNTTLNLIISDANDTPEVDAGVDAQQWTGAGNHSFTLPSDIFSDADLETLVLSAQLASGEPLPAWLSFDSSTGTFSGNPPRLATTLNIVVIASDSETATAQASFQLSFSQTNDAPTATSISTQTFEGAGDWSYTLASNAFSDADADTLKYSASLQDGSSLPGWLTFDRVTGTFQGNPPTGSGDLSLRVTATDNSGLSASTNFTLDINQLTGVNDAPTLEQTLTITPSFSGAGNLTVTVPLAETFVDLDQDALTYSARLADGSSLPSWLSFDAVAGTLTGNPPHDATSLAIVIVATDSNNASTESGFTLTLTATNDTPTRTQALNNQTASEDTHFALTLSSNTFGDADPDATLSWSASLNDGSALPAWLSFDSATRTFSGTPGNEHVGNVVIKVTATDAAGSTADASFTLTVNNTNDAPTLITGIANQQAIEDSAFSFQLPNATFADVDPEDTLTYSATLSNGNALPDWLEFDSATRTFSGTPTNSDVGTLSISVSVQDAAGSSVNSTFNLTIANTNDAPVNVGTISNKAATQDQGFAFKVPSNIFADIDATDTLTYTATQTNGNPLPAWLSFNANTQQFSGTPGNSDVGSIGIRVSVTDSSSASAHADFTLNVFDINDAPTLDNAVPDLQATEDIAFSYTLPDNTFSDIDAGTQLRYSATQSDGGELPGWLAFSPTTRTFSGTPGNGDVGTVTVRIIAQDPDGASRSDDFIITVVNVNDAPTLITGLQAQTVAEDQLFTYVIPTATFSEIDAGDSLTYTATLSNGSALPTWLSFNPATLTFSGVPANGDVSNISVRVTATDGSNTSAVADFNLTVTNVNDVPQLTNALQPQTATEDQAFSFSVPDNTFSEIDAGDSLTYSATQTDGNALPGWLSFNTTTRIFTGTPTNADVGIYAIRVTVTDGSNTSITSDFSLSVINTNDVPVVVGSLATQSATQDQSFTFKVPGTTFVDIDPSETLTYSATLANGQPLPNWLAFNPSTLQFSGTPGNSNVGTITLRVTVTDSAQTTAHTDFTLNVFNVNDAPTLANPVPNQTATEDSVFTYTIPGNTFIDIDAGSNLTYAARLADGGELPGWLSFNNATRTFSGTPTNSDVGAITVRIFAFDPDGASRSDDFIVTVINVNDTPVLANAIPAQSATEDQAFTYTVPANTFNDIDVGDSFTYTATLANGSPLPGWLSFNANNRTFSGTPTNDNVGTLTVRVTATDGSSASVNCNFTLVIHNSNDAPTLVNALQAQQAIEDQAFSYTVPASTFNDIDIGDTLTYSASLSSGSPLPGWLTFNANTRTFSGTPANADVGALSVRVTATDSSHASVSSTFDLSVQNTNDAPTTVASVATQSATRDQSFTFRVNTQVFSDVDVGDTLSYSAMQSNGNPLPSWLSFNPATLQFAGTPTNADIGTLTLRVIATDLSNTSTQTDFTLNVFNLNDAPTLNMPVPAQQATEDSAFLFVVPQDTFTDIDAGTSLIYSARLADGADLPTWLSFDSNTRTFSGTPGNDAVGTLAIRLTAADPDGAGRNVDFNLTISNVNDAPTVTQALQAQTATEDQLFNFVVPANTFNDIDVGDTLTLSATLANGDALPAWLQFNVQTQTFSGTPTNADVGNVSLRVTATDGSNSTITSDFLLTVVNANDSPTLVNAIPTQSATENQVFSFTVPANSFGDVDAGDTLSYAATLTNGSPLPVWLSFDVATRTFSGIPDNGDVGNLAIRVIATDPSNTSASADFTLTILNANDAPTLSNPLSSQAATEDQIFVFNLPGNTFNDIDAGDVLRYQATLANGDALPDWLRFDSATQSFNGTPTNSDIGNLTVRVTATDTSNATSTAEFALSITNVNDAPIATGSINTITGNEGEALSVTLPADLFVDIDAGSNLTLTASLTNGSLLPAWLSFDPVTGTLSGIPLGIDGQPIIVRITASDAEGTTATVDITFDITPTPIVVPPTTPPVQIAPPAPITPIVTDSGSGTPLSQGLSSAGMGGGTGIGGTASQLPISESSTPLSQGLNNLGSTITPVGSPSGAFGGSVVFNVGPTISSGYDVPLSSSLSVREPLPNMRMSSGQVFEFTLPRNTFSRPSGTSVGLQATLADGRPLPSWLRFDPVTETFSGVPPRGAQQGELQIRVTARDGSGNEVSVEFELQMQPETPTGNETPAPDASLSVEQAWLQAFTSPTPESSVRAHAGDLPLDAQLAQITARSSGDELQALWQSLLSLVGDSQQRPG